VAAERYLLEGLREQDRGFGPAEEEHSAGTQGAVDPLQDFAAGCGVEVDEHVPKEGDVEPGRRRPRLDQVERAELDGIAGGRRSIASSFPAAGNA